MSRWIGMGICLSLLAGAPSIALGQAVPAAVGPPPPPSTVPPGPPGATPPAPVAAPNNIWSFLCPTPEQKAACKTKICNSMAGQLLNNALKPASAMTGGVIPLCCPPPGQDNAYLRNPPDSALGAAARIQQDEAAAKARRAAVRYLGTVNCNYWPEAQEALINSLRADRNECVRWEAAMALSRGCCCKLGIIKALVLTVSGGTADGNPAENCERVKIAASGALSHCLSCYSEVVPVPVPAPIPPAALEVLPKTRPEPVPTPKREGEKLPPPPTEKVPPPTPTPLNPGTARVQPIGYYERIGPLNESEVIREAQQILARTHPAGSSPAPKGPPCRDGLVSLFGSVFGAGREGPSAVSPEIKTAPDNPASLPTGFSTQWAPASTTASPAPTQRNGGEFFRDAFGGSTAAKSGPPLPDAAQTAPGNRGNASAVVPAKAPPPLSLPAPPTPVSALPMGAPAPVSQVVYREPAPAGASSFVSPPANGWSSVVTTVYWLEPHVAADCLRTATHAVDPFQRENAVHLLSHTAPADVEAIALVLIDLATRDSAALVRAACLRSLMAMNIKNARLRLQELVEQARKDKDPRVQVAVREMQTWLGADKGLVTASQPSGRTTYR